MIAASKTFAGPSFRQDERRCVRCGIDFISKKWQLCPDCRDIEKDVLHLWGGGRTQ